MRARPSGRPVAARSQDPSGRQISRAALEQLRRIYDLDKPWYVQYARLVKRLATLDLGNTWQDGRPIAETIGEALPVTLLLMTLALEYTHGNHRDAARLLGISRQTMRVKLRALGLHVAHSVEPDDDDAP